MKVQSAWVANVTYFYPLTFLFFSLAKDVYFKREKEERDDDVCSNIIMSIVRDFHLYNFISFSLTNVDLIDGE